MSNEKEGLQRFAEALRKSGEPPCTKLECAKLVRCSSKRLACRAFKTYVDYGELDTVIRTREDGSFEVSVSRLVEYRKVKDGVVVSSGRTRKYFSPKDFEPSEAIFEKIEAGTPADYEEKWL